MASEHVYVAAVAGVCFFGLLVMTTIALLLGRGLRAQGVARLGHHKELSVQFEVPAVAARSGSPPNASPS